MINDLNQIDFNWVVKEYMETSNTLELVIIRDGKSFSKYEDGKLYIHI